MDNVLVIDGPAQGKVYAIKGHRFSVPGEVRVNATMPQITYHIHKFYLLGRFLRVASVHLNSDDIDLKDAFDLIASDKAKEAAS
jgi:hypothetical protein